MERALILATMALVLAGAAPGTAHAASEPAPQTSFAQRMEEAAELIRQGLGKAVDSVDALLRAAPQYEMPRMNENGDIIIRRKRPDNPVEPPAQPSVPPGSEAI